MHDNAPQHDIFGFKISIFFWEGAQPFSMQPLPILRPNGEGVNPPTTHPSDPQLQTTPDTSGSRHAPRFLWFHEWVVMVQKYVVCFGSHTMYRNSRLRASISHRFYRPTILVAFFAWKFCYCPRGRPLAAAEGLWSITWGTPRCAALERWCAETWFWWSWVPTSESRWFDSTAAKCWPYASTADHTCLQTYKYIETDRQTNRQVNT